MAANDGQFYMPIELYKKTFTTATVNYFKDWKSDSTGIITTKVGANRWTFTLENPVD